MVCVFVVTKLRSKQTNQQTTNTSYLPTKSPLSIPTALCYPECNAGFYGVGPVCWKSCEGKLLTDGGAICCTDAATCKDDILAMSVGVPKAIMELILSGGDPEELLPAIKDAINAALAFVMPICGKE